MTELRNVARERLLGGEVALGVGIRLARSIDVVRVMRRAGYHWLFLDLEHGAMSLDMASQIAIAALDAGIAPLARVPSGAFSMATRLLDNGALGIVMPHVETEAEAREIVRQLKYPPAGSRSISSNVPQFDYAGGDVAALTTALNALTLTVVMVETARGIANVDAIAAVPGVDVVLIGTNDLCADLGITGKFSDPAIDKAYAAVVAACRAHGKWPGMGGIRSPALMRRHMQGGVRFVLAGSDLTLMAQAAAQQAAELGEGAPPTPESTTPGGRS